MGKHLVPVAVYPLFGFMAVAMGGASWYVSRLARNPDVMWNRKATTKRWDSVEQGYTTKMMDPNGSFGGKFWKRSFF
ncbi:hypothetical protein BC829DRAFT_486953 [Chytridium lagenaria]|nr:hypothetical protein BC829DRAFT_486953 [Chytridium lagenaria]